MEFEPSCAQKTDIPIFCNFRFSVECAPFRTKILNSLRKCHSVPTRQFAKLDQPKNRLGLSAKVPNSSYKNNP